MNPSTWTEPEPEPDGGDEGRNNLRAARDVGILEQKGADCCPAEAVRFRGRRAVSIFLGRECPDADRSAATKAR
jgi:hypothetical protein